MRFSRYMFALALFLLPAAAAERAAFGVVATDAEAQIHSILPVHSGAVVDSVWPGSPADKAGMKPGYIIVSMNNETIQGREMLSDFLSRRKPGDTIRVGYYAEGALRSLTVTLIARPQHAKGASSPTQAVHADRVKRPVAVEPEIREAMREHRAAICRHLAAMPEGLEPAAVSDALQAIRNLARDVNAGDKAWMPGKAGESTLQLRDAEGTLLLTGASNCLMLEAYDKKGTCVFRGPLDTPEQRRAVPAPVLQRLHQL